MFILNIILAIYFSSFGWSGLRVLDTTIFDLLTPLVLIIAAVANQRAQKSIYYRSFIRNLSLSCIIMIAAGFVASIFSNTPIETILKSITIAFSLLLTGTTLLFIINTNILAENTIIKFLILSSTAHSTVSFMQMQLGVLRGISGYAEDWTDWSRPTGLTGHPVEAGLVSGIGVILCVSEILRSQGSIKSWVFIFGATLINFIGLYEEASFTGIIASLAAILILTLSVRSRGSIIVTAMAILLLFGIRNLIDDDSPLGQRLQSLSGNGLSYVTIQTRRDQITEVIEGINPKSFFVGNGYDPTNLPQGLEIHNGILASIYHFGVLGLVSQMTLILICLYIAFKEKDYHKRRRLFAITVLFLSAYLTGPTLSRRSIWVPLLAVTCLSISKTTRYNEMPRLSVRARHGAIGRPTMA